MTTKRLVITLVAVCLGLLFALGVMSQAARDDRDATEAVAASGPDAGSDAAPDAAAPADEAAAAPPAPTASSRTPPSPPTADGTVPVQPPVDAADDPDEAALADADADADELDAGGDPAATAPSLVDLGALRVRAPQSTRSVVLGSLSRDSPALMRVELTRWGAAVRRITLNRYRESVEPESDPYVVLEPTTSGGQRQFLYNLAVTSVTINGKTLPLERIEAGQTLVWELIDSSSEHAVYRMTVETPEGESVLAFERRFELPPDSYELVLKQRLINLSDGPLEVSFRQNAQGDLPLERGYLGDQRRLEAGYFDLDYDPRRVAIYTDDTYVLRTSVIESAPTESIETVPGFWPIDAAAQHRMVWVARSNRYFSVVVRRWFDPERERVTADVPPLDETFPALGRRQFGFEHQGEDGDGRALMLTLGAAPAMIPAGEAASRDLAVFAGPRKRELFEEAPYDVLHYDKLIVYQLSCTFCTFQWLARFLLWFLTVIETVVADWAIAIIVLVIVVRTLLHPITRQSQINMMKMGKQMQALQPELEKIKKKYGDDQQKVGQETMRLYREHGVNPANMLGCLPMFLQMPIWIALYAMLYFAIELRHEPAFFGLFQAISGGAWDFLADLSQPDNFLRFSEEGVTIPLIFAHPTFYGLNILPILWGGTMFIQQRLTMPPATSDQARQQQRIMQIMTLMFPLFLYSMPSGLMLYMLASAGASILDNWLVRRHIKQQEEAGTLLPEKKPPKPGGFMDRLTKLVEEKQSEMQAKQEQPAGGRPGAGAGGAGFKSRKKKK